MASPPNNFRYIAPTNFFIGQTPPDDLPADVHGTFSVVYAAIQQVIQTLVTNCGVGSRNNSQWAILAGSASTLLGSNLNRFYATASENITFGAAVHFTNVAGILNARNANATNNTKPARGFCNTIGGVATGNIAEFIINSGTVTLAGLTPGQNYFLSTTNGVVSNTPAVAAGNIEQYLGFAINSTTLSFNLSYWIQR